MDLMIPLAGVMLCFTALLVFVFTVVKPRTSLVPEARRRPFGDKDKSVIAGLADSTVAVLGKSVGGGPYSRSRLEDAGVRMPPSSYLFLVLSATLIMGLLGLFLSGLPLSLLLLVIAPTLAWLVLGILADRRRTKFDQQLSDNLMLITGGLRAGHSVLAAIDAAAKEAASPSSEEFARVVNQVRIGRDLDTALTETASRMKSDDFSWVGQAIQINREAGGDLAEVLDHVGETIWERSEIKSQVQALSAEGKLSAIILMCLPFAIGLLISVVNPTYMGVLFSSLLGWVLLGTGAVMLIIGGLWMRKIIRIEF